MTYWAREHEHNLRRIGDVMRELEHAYEDIIPALWQDLLDDLTGSSLDTRTALLAARTELRDARSRVAQAMAALDRAREALPNPQYRPTVHPTASEVLERDA